jgi:trimethylamine:corrinoid methyltransferase-like protein
LEVLEKKDVEGIHGIAMKVLSELGVKMDHPEALKIFKANVSEIGEPRFAFRFVSMRLIVRLEAPWRIISSLRS